MRKLYSTEIVFRDKMLYVYVSLAVLVVGDCSLTPIMRPLMSLFDGSRMASPIRNPKHSRVQPNSYRIQGSLAPRLPPTIGVTAENQWDRVNVRDIIPEAVPIDIKNPLSARLEPLPVETTGYNDMHMMKPHRYDHSGRWVGDNSMQPWQKYGHRDVNRNWLMMNRGSGEGMHMGKKQGISPKPLEASGYADIKKTWMMKEGSGEHRDARYKETLYVNPYKNGGTRSYKNTMMILESGESNGVINKNMIGEGSNEIKVPVIRGDLKKRIKYNSGNENNWVSTGLIERKPGLTKKYWRSSWMGKGGDPDPGHDSDDQPDHDRQAHIKIRMKPKMTEGSHEKTHQIWIITNKKSVS